MCQGPISFRCFELVIQSSSGMAEGLFRKSCSVLFSQLDDSVVSKAVIELLWGRGVLVLVRVVVCMRGEQIHGPPKKVSCESILRGSLSKVWYT